MANMSFELVGGPTNRATPVVTSNPTGAAIRIIAKPEKPIIVICQYSIFDNNRLIDLEERVSRLEEFHA